MDLFIKTKKKTKPKKIPAPADTGVGTYHAAFTPLKPEVNEPQATEDPFAAANSFAPCVDEDFWGEEGQEEEGVVGEEEQLQRDDDEGDSWGAYDSTETVAAASDEDDVSMCSSPPTTSAADNVFQNFMSRRRKSLKEHRAVYTGPQLTLDDDNDDECV
jgi:hypothetical protein